MSAVTMLWISLEPVLMEPPLSDLGMVAITLLLEVICSLVKASQWVSALAKTPLISMPVH
jgi:hypothetical protein